MARSFSMLAMNATFVSKGQFAQFVSIIPFVVSSKVGDVAMSSGRPAKERAKLRLSLWHFAQRGSNGGNAGTVCVREVSMTQKFNDVSRRKERSAFCNATECRYVRDASRSMHSCRGRLQCDGCFVLIRKVLHALLASVFES